MDKSRETSQTDQQADVNKNENEDHRVSKAIEEEEAFLEYIMSLPAMSVENVETYMKKQPPVLVRSTSECTGGLEHLENLYKLMEHLGQLRKQNSKLQKRVKYLENIAQEDVQEVAVEDINRVETRRKRSAKYKSGSNVRQSLIRTSRERSRSVGVEEMVKSRQIEGSVKSKVSKWTKVKEAFRWEKVLLPETQSQDSGLGGGESLRVPSDHSSFSVSPADSLLSGPQPLSSVSSSEDEFELDGSADSEAGNKRCGSNTDNGSQIKLRPDGQDSRRSKSLDGDVVDCKSNQFHKSHKTPWSKVKDIIQTRTGSIKKKRTENDLDDDIIAVGDLSGSEDNTKDSEDKLSDIIQSEQINEGTDLGTPKIGEKISKKRLAPVLTITLPSTEELTSIKSDVVVTTPKLKPPQSPQLDEKHPKYLVKQRTLDEIALRNAYRKQVSSSSAGTSPPTPRRQSKWSKVKNAFLTSTPSPEDMIPHVSNSVPSSPIKHTSFLYDLESDDMSSGEFIDDNLRDNNDDVFPESIEDGYGAHCDTSNENIHNEIKRNFEELQLRLSNEFHQKLNEWERLKNSGSGVGIPPSAGKVSGSGVSSGTSSVGEDEKAFKKKVGEWDKIKNPKQRELALQHLGEENLSPDFKKKLEKWEKLKSIPMSPTPESSNNSQPQFKKKITEWQRWRTGTSSSKIEMPVQNIPSDLPEEFSRKLLEWEKLKQGIIESDSSIRPANRSPSPGTSRKEFIEHKPKKTQPRSSELGNKIIKSKSHHEVKELAWLEKELHKIEREKQRLERERDKYLEREARLEKMKRAIGSTQQKQEILIPTSTGLFRFQGISQKFTRKLYEWEKAKGIGPEASTFALLDPGYQPPTQCGQKPGEGIKKNGALLMRSKSVGSVVDVGSSGSSPGGITHQPSSLSLNNMEEIDSSDLTCRLDQQILQGDISDSEEPQAIIVDVEDVIEEIASPLIEQHAVVSETPVYCYAPDEVTRLIDSSGSDNEVGGSDNVQSSYIILQENINLLDKLQRKEDICRKLESEMEDLEEQMNNSERNREKQLESLERVEPKPVVGTTPYDEGTDGDEQALNEIKAQLQLIEKQQEELMHEEKTLQYSFVEHSEQQAVLAQNLVDNMRQLQEVNSVMSPNSCLALSVENPSMQQQEALTKVQDLSSQLLSMAERLETIMGERNKELWRLKEINVSDKFTRHPGLSHHSYSTDSISAFSGGRSLNKLPRQNSEELSNLPTLLTNKVLELKRGLSYLCAVTDIPKAVKMSDSSENLPTHEIDYESTSIKVGNEDQATHIVSSIKSLKNINEKTDEHGKTTDHDYNETCNKPDGCAFVFPLVKSATYEHRKKFQKTESIDNPTVQIVKYPKMAINPETNVEETQNTTKITRHKLLETSLHNDNRRSGQESHLSVDKNSKYNKEDDSTSRKLRRTKRTIERSNKCISIHSRINDDDEGNDCNYEDLPNHADSVLSNKQIGSKNMKYKTAKTALKHSLSTGNSNTQIEANSIKSDNANLDIDLSRRFSDSKKTTYKDNENCCKSFKGKSSKLLNDKKLVNSGSVNVSSPEQQDTDEVTTVNVFVPTTRKIFSPVRRDSKGKTSSVIGYIVRDPTNNDELVENNQESNSECHRKLADQLPKLNSEISNQNFPEETINKREEINFIYPPCWILRERAQSASPALQRKHFSANKKRENQLDLNCEKDDNYVNKDVNDNENNPREEFPDSKVGLSNSCHANVNEKINSCKTPPLPKRERYYTKDSPIAESTSELSSPTELKPTSNRKSRPDVGFPPISPIPGRRDMKIANKDAAPSIRMMIARYNQKVSESQELLGSKSPDNGSASSVAWRSPGTERRVKAQMEKYQEEVRKALQNTSGEKRKYVVGEVKKSASASLIRTWDKGGLQDGFNRRPSDGSQDRPNGFSHCGILKSSSAGSIKTSNTISSKCYSINLKEDDSLTLDNVQASNVGSLKSMNESNLELRNVDSSKSDTPSFDLQTNAEPINTTNPPSIQESIIIQPESFGKSYNNIGGECSNYVQNSPESSRLRALKLKKAKEDFLLRGPGGGSWSSDCSSVINSKATSVTSVAGQWSNNKGRLSQISCESDCSYEGILVSGEKQQQDAETRLLVKSASAGMINIDSTALCNVLPESPSNSSVPSGSSDLGAIPKSNKFGLSHLANRFRKVRMRKHKDRDKDSQSKMETVSALCRQSLLIDLQRNRSADRKEVVTSSKSCPSSPVLQKRDSASNWIMKPHKIFKQK